MCHYCGSGTTRTTVCCMNTSTMAFVPKEDYKCTHSSLETFLMIILTRYDYIDPEPTVEGLYKL